MGHTIQKGHVLGLTLGGLLWNQHVVWEWDPRAVARPPLGPESGKEPKRSRTCWDQGVQEAIQGEEVTKILTEK